jgi:hypothetical protein
MCGKADRWWDNGTENDLLRIIADPASRMSRCVQITRTGYAQEQNLTTIALLRSASGATGNRCALLHLFLFSGDDVSLVGVLSFGERARLSLAGLVASGATCCCSDSRSTTGYPRIARFEQAWPDWSTIWRCTTVTLSRVLKEIWEISGDGIQRWENVNFIPAGCQSQVSFSVSRLICSRLSA